MGEVGVKLSSCRYATYLRYIMVGEWSHYSARSWFWPFWRAPRIRLMKLCVGARYAHNILCLPRRGSWDRTYVLLESSTDDQSLKTVGEISCWSRTISVQCCLFTLLSYCPSLFLLSLRVPVESKPGVTLTEGVSEDPEKQGHGCVRVPN